MMTVGELKELLEGLDDATEVRLATQPSYPLAFRVRGLRTQADIDVNEAFEEIEGSAEAWVDEDAVRAAAEPIVWLVEGGSPDHPYAPRAAWNL